MFIFFISLCAALLNSMKRALYKFGIIIITITIYGNAYINVSPLIPVPSYVKGVIFCY